jgi:23S rRNA (pseudouridine1915-N3)-methyltransferase
MIVTLLVCGKLKPGPESDLVRDYLNRAKQQGRQLGISDVKCREVPMSAGIQKKQAGQLALSACASAERKIVLDETGKQISSEQFAHQLNQWREQGVHEICLLIGPADGWSPEVQTQADLLLGLGRMTWPHKLAQVMAAEQIYRALSILAGSAYHRGNS